MTNSATETVSLLREALAGVSKALGVLAGSEHGRQLAVRWRECADQLLLLTEALVLQAPEDPMQAQAPAAPASRPLKVLIAEDTDFNFELFQSYLRDQPYEVLRARNGAQAVEMVRASQCDLVLMDGHMPVLDGYSATRQIREWEQQQGRGRIPIVLVSAEDVSSQMRLGSEAGCSGYLAKPITKAQLLTALKLYSP